MSSVFANSRSIVHKGDGLVQTCPVPDVCKTPSPGGPIPVPYVNVARDSDLASGSTTVVIEGNPAALEDSNLSTSSGDEAGTAGGGVVSSKIKGKMTWSSCSADVKFDGKGVVRFLDICLHNGNTSNDGGQPHTGSPTAYGGEQPCPLCGAVNGHPIPSGKESQREAAQIATTSPPHKLKNGEKKGYMIGVLHCVTEDGKHIFLRAASGLPPDGFRSLPDLTKLKDQIKPFDATKVSSRGGKIFEAEEIDNKPGVCAAAKLLDAARQMGLKPLQMTEIWQGPRSSKQKPGKHAESCETCKQLLPAMLCDKA